MNQIKEREFYLRMDELNGISRHVCRALWGPWSQNATICARTMRAYVDVYHPLERAGLPDAVREIFTEQREGVAELV